MSLLALALVCMPASAPSAADSPGQPQFARDLVRVTAPGAGNVACSPWSLGRLLALLEFGARGETAHELHSVLHTAAASSIDEYMQLSAVSRPPELAGAHKSEPAYTLALAQSLWSARTAAPAPAFVARARSAFDAHCATLDFASPDARTTIHDWVREATSGRIREVLPAGTPNAGTRLVLVDTIHLVATWQDPFSEAATKPGTFTRGDGSGVEVPFLRRTGNIACGESALARVVTLPYDGGLELVLALPKSPDGLDALVAREGSAEWTTGLETRRVEILLPKLAFESQLDLVSPLRALGLDRSFDRERAEFPGVCAGEPLYVDVVVQRVRLAVDEHGTEASAATAITLRTGARRQDGEPIAFHLDRPFAFALRHRATRCVLFAGVVRDPSLTQ